MSLQVPPTETTEPVIVVPVVALHASFASPEKLRPMLESLRPVTVPFVAANAGSVMAGTNASTITATSSRDKNRLDIRWIMIVFSFSV